MARTTNDPERFRESRTRRNQAPRAATASASAPAVGRLVRMPRVKAADTRSSGADTTSVVSHTTTPVAVPDVPPDDVRNLAYFLSLDRGDSAPDPLRDWLEAERRIRGSK